MKPGEPLARLSEIENMVVRIKEVTGDLTRITTELKSIR